jgi:hypothetical protein
MKQADMPSCLEGEEQRDKTEQSDQPPLEGSNPSLTAVLNVLSFE